MSATGKANYVGSGGVIAACQRRVEAVDALSPGWATPGPSPTASRQSDGTGAQRETSLFPHGGEDR